MTDGGVVYSVGAGPWPDPWPGRAAGGSAGVHRHRSEATGDILGLQVTEAAGSKATNKGDLLYRAHEIC